MKVLVFTDAHTGRFAIQQVEQASLNVWNWAYDQAINEKVDIIIFLGDRCRSRDPEGVIRDEADNGLIKLAERFAVIALCGNHDYYFKEGSLLNNYGVLKKWNNINVVSDGVIVDLGGMKCEFLPYGQTPSGNADYLFMHDEIEGATKWIKKKGITVKSLKSYKHVYVGHIHNRIQFKNVTYVNVPYQQSFGDGTPVGGLVLNLKTGSESWIPGFGPRFVTGIGKDLTNCIVRVGTEEEKEIALKKGAIYVEIMGVEEQEQVAKTEEDVSGADFSDWIQEYVDRFGAGSLLYKDIGLMVLEQVQEVG